MRIFLSLWADLLLPSGPEDQPLSLSFIHIAVASGLALGHWQPDDNQIKDHCFNGSAIGLMAL